MKSELSSTDLTIVDTSLQKSTEKKVRFSEDLIQETSQKDSKSGKLETKASSLKNSKPACDLKHGLESVKNIQGQEDLQRKMLEQFDGQKISVPEISALPESFQMQGNKNKTKEVLCFNVGSQNGHDDASASIGQELLCPMEHLKNSLSSNKGMCIDISCSAYILFIYIAPVPAVVYSSV